MSNRIDTHRPADADAAQRVAAKKAGERTSSDRAPVDRTKTGTDRVEVSKDAQLVSSALKAATDSPEVRHDVVERMRKLLDSGELGKDSGKLADRLIDALLNK